MFYRMTKTATEPEQPASWYLKGVIQGYCDFGLTQEDFEESLGVQQLGLTQADIRKILDVTTDELKDTFSAATAAATY